jgi:hypothetical protein
MVRVRGPGFDGVVVVDDALVEAAPAGDALVRDVLVGGALVGRALEVVVVGAGVGVG